MLDNIIFHACLIIIALLSVAILFMVSFGIILLLVKKTFDGFAEEYSIGIRKAIHALTGWIAALIAKGNLVILQKCGKLIIYQQEPIPWAEKPLFVANHPCSALQDVFTDLVIIFFLRLQNFINPITYFPLVTAEAANFTDRWYGRIMRICTISLARDDKSREYKALLIALRHVQNNGTVIAYIEGGRTPKALTPSISEKGNLLREFTNGAAYLSLKTGRPIVVVWKKLEGCEDILPEDVGALLLIKGLWRLFFDPKVKMFYDIGMVVYPERVVNLRNKKERVVAIEAYNKRIRQALFTTADRQTVRLEGG